MVVHVLKAPAYICYQREHWQHCYRSAQHSDKYWCVIWTDITMEQVLMYSLKQPVVSFVGMTYHCQIRLNLHNPFE